MTYSGHNTEADVNTGFIDFKSCRQLTTGGSNTMENRIVCYPLSIGRRLAFVACFSDLVDNRSVLCFLRAARF